MLKKILIKGAKEHNLQNISLEIPKETIATSNTQGQTGVTLT